MTYQRVNPKFQNVTGPGWLNELDSCGGPGGLNELGSCRGPGWVNELGSWITYQFIQAYHQ